MKYVDSRTGTIWLDVKEFAEKQRKDPVTIRQWCNSGFVVELGLLVHRDVTGHWKIGIPQSHQSFSQFA
jgi:hypothetical protein